MTHLFNRTSIAVAASAVLGLAAGSAQAQVVINDNLTGGHSLYNWKALNGACLTAGDNTNTPSDGTQYTPSTAKVTIPACVDPTTHANLPYYANATLVGGHTGTLPDASGHGALRLTNGDWKQGSNGDQQIGAVISGFPYPATSGLNITWTTVTYGGDGLSGHGADGMSFFLVDGSKDPQVAGGSGGSLGYSCSNRNPTYDGLVGGYLGIGIDEYGNFTNGGTQTDRNGNYTSDNTSTGPGAAAGTLGVRGAGNVSYAELSALNSTYYPAITSATSPSATLRQTAVQKTCASGKLWDMRQNNGAGAITTTSVPDYKYLFSQALSGVTLANQQATSTNTDTNPNVPIRDNATAISYTLRITSAGKLDFTYNVNGGASATPLSNYDIVANNGALPTNVRFGFSAGTGSGSNVHEITCFKAAPSDVSNTSAGSNVQQAGKVISGSQVFIAYYHPTNWWGSLQANALTYDSSTDSLVAASSATWDASCKLTGGSCPAISSSSTITAQSTRVILSNDGGSNGGSGVAFTASGLTSSQLSALSDTTSSAPQIAYLRGTRTNEASNGGTYRNRTSLLGDIVDSSPVWVGYPNSSYNGPWTDKLGRSANASMPEGTTYASWASSNVTRRNVLYVGANDGMLHGFSAGSFNAPSGGGAPTFNSTNNDGTELIAYVPAQVISAIHPSATAIASTPALAAVDFSNPSYVHNFFVDATPGTGDLYYGSSPAWHTWLVGGLGPGGHPSGAIQDNTASITAPVSSFFVLDVTNPTNFSEANASSLVVGEWNSNTLSCNIGPSNCGIHLGQTLGTPVIRRLHDGTWGVIFGNGTNSVGDSTAAGHSGLFIMHVAADGTKSFQYIDAGTTAHGGIVQVAAADLDGDHITDFVYAGDVLGNLYRFDLTAGSASSWSAMKIFQTSSWQPITSTPVVTSIPSSGTGNPKVIVAFGTGQKLPVTTTAAETYAATTSTQKQAIYGIWDANMTAWNTASSDSKYAALAQTNSTTPVTITASLLQTQTVTSETTTTRNLSNTAMCWVGMTGCASGATTGAMGWVLNLPTSTEQLVFNPMVANGDMFFNTTIPATTSLFTCTSTDIAGWTMGINLGNGGAGAVPAFDGSISGYSLNGAGTPAVYGYGSSSYLGTNTNDHHQFKSKKLAPQPGVGKRLTWTKIR